MSSHDALFSVADAERWARTDRPPAYGAPADEQRTRPRVSFRQLARPFATWAAAGVVIGVILAVGLPYLFHGRAFTVMSGSMEPTIHVGDVIVDERISPLDARIGDIVTFRDPHGSTRVFTHRVRRITISRGWAHFVSKGDANNVVEHWAMKTDGSIGRVRYRIPHLGYAVFYAHTIWGRIVLVLMPLLAFAAMAVRRIWR